MGGSTQGEWVRIEDRQNGSSRVNRRRTGRDRRLRYLARERFGNGHQAAPPRASSGGWRDSPCSSPSCAAGRRSPALLHAESTVRIDSRAGSCTSRTDAARSRRRLRTGQQLPESDVIGDAGDDQRRAEDPGVDVRHARVRHAGQRQQRGQREDRTNDRVLRTARDGHAARISHSAMTRPLTSSGGAISASIATAAMNGTSTITHCAIGGMPSCGSSSTRPKRRR